ncbi:hypothetical protein L2E82_48289 [Cichorium intybus]|uniref:Uncharacterized protein n=1 Tax=Cichorium intybus TaxID=13427 RepID=A0ACB8YZB7_CICIN|nr:hypothetical protein L2E82_48289 [Cichorium intybus]
MKNWCPLELRVRGGIGCRSTGQVYKSLECYCKGEFSTPLTCKPSHYTSSFERVCPRSHTLLYNADNTGHIFMCKGAEYNVTYCPSSEVFSTIQSGGRLRSTDRLLSHNGTFMLGFYGETYAFLGIWHSDDEDRKVWVAYPSKTTLSTLGAHDLSIDPKIGDLTVIVDSKLFGV